MKAPVFVEIKGPGTHVRGHFHVSKVAALAGFTAQCIAEASLSPLQRLEFILTVRWITAAMTEARALFYGRRIAPHGTIVPRGH